MMIAKLKNGEVFHRISSASSSNATAYCGEKGVMNWDDESEVITCPKCNEMHKQMTLSRLRIGDSEGSK